MNTEANIKGQNVYRGETRAGGRRATSCIFGCNLVLSASWESKRQLKAGLGVLTCVSSY